FTVDAAASGSLTDVFSQAFLETYLQAGGGQVLDQEQQQVIVNDLLARFTTEASALISSRYGKVAVRTDAQLTVSAYAGTLTQALTIHEVEEGAGNPVELMQA